MPFYPFDEDTYKIQTRRTRGIITVNSLYLLIEDLIKEQNPKWCKCKLITRHNNNNTRAYLLELPMPEYALFSNEGFIMHENPHLSIDQFYATENSRLGSKGFSTAHYTERYYMGSATIVVHVYFNSTGSMIATQTKKNIDTEPQTPSVDLELTNEQSKIIEERAKLGREKLINLIKIRDDRYLAAQKRSNELDQKLGKYRSKQNATILEFKQIAEEFIEQIRLINRHSDVEQDVRDLRIKDLLKAYQSISDNASSTALDPCEIEENPPDKNELTLARSDNNAEKLKAQSIKIKAKKEVEDLTDKIRELHKQLALSTVEDKDLYQVQIDQVDLNKLLERYNLIKKIEDLELQKWCISSYNNLQNSNHHELTQGTQANKDQLLELKKALLGLFRYACVTGNIVDIQRIYPYLDNLDYNDIVEILIMILLSKYEEEKLIKVLEFLLNSSDIFRRYLAGTLYHLESNKIKISPLFIAFMTKKFKLLNMLLTYISCPTKLVCISLSEKEISLIHVIAAIKIEIEPKEFTLIMRAIINNPEDLFLPVITTVATKINESYEKLLASFLDIYQKDPFKFVSNCFLRTGMFNYKGLPTKHAHDLEKKYLLELAKIFHKHGKATSVNHVIHIFKEMINNNDTPVINNPQAVSSDNTIAGETAEKFPENRYIFGFEKKCPGLITEIVSNLLPEKSSLLEAICLNHVNYLEAETATWLADLSDISSIILSLGILLNKPGINLSYIKNSQVWGIKIEHHFNQIETLTTDSLVEVAVESSIYNPVVPGNLSNQNSTNNRGLLAYITLEEDASTTAADQSSIINHQSCCSKAKIFELINILVNALKEKIKQPALSVIEITKLGVFCKSLHQRVMVEYNANNNEQRTTNNIGMLKGCIIFLLAYINCNKEQLLTGSPKEQLTKVLEELIKNLSLLIINFDKQGDRKALEIHLKLISWLKEANFDLAAQFDKMKIVFTKYKDLLSTPSEQLNTSNTIAVPQTNKVKPLRIVD